MVLATLSDGADLTSPVPDGPILMNFLLFTQYVSPPCWQLSSGTPLSPPLKSCQQLRLSDLIPPLSFHNSSSIVLLYDTICYNKYITYNIHPHHFLVLYACMMNSLKRKTFCYLDSFCSLYKANTGPGTCSLSQ